MTWIVDMAFCFIPSLRVLGTHTSLRNPFSPRYAQLRETYC